MRALQALVMHAQGTTCHGLPACRVALGRVTKGTSGLRRAPLGYQSTCNDPNPGSPALSKSLIYAIYDNAQCYPEYRIFYDVR